MAAASEHAHLSHDHVFLGTGHDENARRTLWVVALTAAMMVAEIVAGYLTGSMALLADGFHMATHAGALGIAALAYRYARRHAHDPSFSFGTGKVGDLSGFASALVLAIIAIGIGIESIGRLLQPVTVAYDEATLVAALGLLVNIASALLLAGGHHDHEAQGHHHDHHRDHDHHHGNTHGADNNLRSAYFHVLADALTSVLAILALLAGRFLGWVWVDPAMGIIGGIVIARWSWVLMRDTAAVLLDRTAAPIELQLRQRLQSIGDVRIADLHVWRVGPQAHAAIVSVACDETESAIRQRLEPVRGLSHLTIEVRCPFASPR